MEHFKFLLATDYSEAVMNAERYAVQIAEETASTLNFLHVYSIPVSFPTQAVEYSRRPEEVYVSEQTFLERHRSDLFDSLQIKPGKIAGERFVREGLNISKHIQKVAEETHTDFIVVGTHGVSGFRETFFGSHSWDVIRRSNLPVFAIPESALFTGIRNIVYGTATREIEEPVLDFLIHFAQQFNAELNILYVTNHGLSAAFETEMFDKFRSEIKSRFMYSRLEVHLLMDKDITEGIDHYCFEHRTSLLAMSIPKMSLFEKILMPELNLTRKMTFHSRIPILTIPSGFHFEHAENHLQAHAAH